MELDNLDSRKSSFLFAAGYQLTSSRRGLLITLLTTDTTRRGCNLRFVMQSKRVAIHWQAKSVQDDPSMAAGSLSSSDV